MGGERPILADAELARRIAAVPPGEARADESQLCARFGRRIRLYGLRHLRDEQAAADLVQRVLVVTIEKLRSGEVRHAEQIASFVLGVARTVVREMGRPGRRERPLPAGIEEALAAPPGDADAAALERLAPCLEALGERERTVLLLTFYEERSAAEIAATISTSVGNVRVVRHRAIARLRDCMGLSREPTP